MRLAPWYLLTACLLLLGALSPARGDDLGYAFTYQGRVLVADNPLNAPCDFRFGLWDAAAGGVMLAERELLGVPVTDGLFQVSLDFGDQHFVLAQERYLSIAVRHDGQSWVPLPGRQRVAPTAYAITALSSLLAVDTQMLDGQGAAFYRDASNINAGTLAESFLAPEMTRDSEVWALVLSNDGAGSGLDADTLDGNDASAFLRAGDTAGNADLLDGLDSLHFLDASNINAGVLADPFIDSVLARDSEVWSLVLSNDGAGSGLDADFLDGRSASEFVDSVGGGLLKNGSTVSLDFGSTDGRYVNENQSGSVSTSMIQSSAVNASGLASDANSLFRVSGGVVNSAGGGLHIGGSGAVSSYLYIAGGRQYGVYASADSYGDYAISGRNTHSSGTGITAKGNGESGRYLTVGSGIAAAGSKYGVYGYGSQSGDGGQAGAYFENGSGGWAKVATRSTGGVNYKIQGTGTVSTVMDTSVGRVSLACPESPEAWFEDFGSGEIVDGICRIELDPIFLECVTISDEHPMRVFVQLTSPLGAQFYVRKGLTSFEVVVQDDPLDVLRDAAGAPPRDATFDFRVVAKWKGMEDFRFEPADEPDEVVTSRD